MFDKKWEIDYFFIENVDGEPECLLCHRKVSRSQRFELERHFRSCHKDYMHFKDEERANLLLSLKFKSFDSIFGRSIFGSKIFIDNQVNKASYVVALALAKRCRPFEDGIFIKDVCHEILDCFGEKSQALSKILESVPLSRQTITRRTEKISQYIFSCTKTRLLSCKYFSLSLDETTDLNSLSQLLICVKSVDDKFVTTEEVLTLVSLHGNANAETIFNVLKNDVFSFLDKEKFASICTDGARVMVGKENGLVGRLIKNGYNVPSFHCIIHQQALFSKSLQMKTVMEVCIKIINKIKGGHNALNHRKFKDFLQEIEADFGDLILHTEVRWLSRGKSLQRLFYLREEVIIFLQSILPNSNELVSFLKDNEFIINFAFFCDITQLLNELNLLLQGKNKKIHELYINVQFFYRKLELVKSQILNNNLKYFPNIQTVSEGPLNSEVIDQFVNIVESLQENYKTRFLDFEKIKSTIDLHDYPLICNLNQYPEEIQKELEILRDDINISLETGEKFWLGISEMQYPHIKNEIFKLYSMFGSTFKCESSFSLLKNIQNKYRNSLSDGHLNDLLKIKSYEKEINIDEIMKM